jgi:hypothetical protein
VSRLLVIIALSTASGLVAGIANEAIFMLLPAHFTEKRNMALVIVSLSCLAKEPQINDDTNLSVARFLALWLCKDPKGVPQVDAPTTRKPVVFF